MGPLRIVIISVLLYLGYRLLVSDWGKRKAQRKEKSQNNSGQDAKDDGPVADVLVEDPICHKLVPKQQAIRLKSKLQDEIVYFCSEECCNLFVSYEGEQK